MFPFLHILFIYLYFFFVFFIGYILLIVWTIFLVPIHRITLLVASRYRYFLVWLRTVQFKWRSVFFECKYAWVCVSVSVALPLLYAFLLVLNFLSFIFYFIFFLYKIALLQVEGLGFIYFILFYFIFFLCRVFSFFARRVFTVSWLPQCCKSFIYSAWPPFVFCPYSGLLVSFVFS